MEMEIRCDGGKKVTADFRGFTVRTDQPGQDGGEDSAPAPFELFLAAIGTCAGIFVYTFCESRKIDARDITLRLRDERSADDKRLEAVGIEIHLPPDFPEKYKKILIRLVDQSAVKKAIKNPPDFDITCVTAGG